MTGPFKFIHRIYARFERPLSSISLIGGFVFNIVTLKRVDLLLENMWIVVHLMVAAVGIIILNFYETRRSRKQKGDSEVYEHKIGTLHEDTARFWIVMLIQFAFGGLFSTFLVFYFRSATLASTWPFLALLTVVFVANELFKKHYLRLNFQISVLFIAIFSFAIYALPVFIHKINDSVFIGSGVLSLLVLWLFIRILVRFTGERFRKGRVLLVVSIATLFAGINLLYFFNLIPPLPLSLKDAAVVHSITRNSAGNYDIQYEGRELKQKVTDFLRSYQIYHQVKGSQIYAYTAIFAPAALDIDIVHEWQKYDDTKGQWVTMTRTPMHIKGGREGGYRTYSNKSSVSAGLWRINIKTSHEKLIGRLKFKIEMVDANVPLEKGVK